MCGSAGEPLLPETLRLCQKQVALRCLASRPAREPWQGCPLLPVSVGRALSATGKDAHRGEGTPEGTVAGCYPGWVSCPMHSVFSLAMKTIITAKCHVSRVLEDSECLKVQAALCFTTVLLYTTRKRGPAPFQNGACSACPPLTFAPPPTHASQENKLTTSSCAGATARAGPFDEQVWGPHCQAWALPWGTARLPTPALGPERPCKGGA